MSIPRGSLVTYQDGTYVVLGFLVSLLKTELVLREWTPAPGAEPIIVRADQRHCVLLTPPARPERTVT